MNTRQAAHQFWWVDLWWPFLDCQQFEKSYKTISKQFEIYHSEVKTIIYKWKIFKTIANLPRSGCPTNTSQTQSQLNVEVHDSAIRKKIYKCCLFGRVAGRKPLLSKKNKKKTWQDDLDLQSCSWTNHMTSGSPFNRCVQSGDVWP